VNNIPGEVLLNKSVRLLKPPNAEMPTMSNTSASRREPYSSEAGMDLRLEVAGCPLGGAHLGSRSVGAVCTGLV